ncbi:hypothetical protein [Kaistella carnis]|uniref:Uncharacterized protein n=1 Tax=Kaistella carnis TaxID=1241979 RepID=A0A3G8XM43_9FLAO|nr:hypothetical protein [Kaistella carnis]AZI33918.1 hypothetical protein EIB73_12295 [Kaistella carnis]
MKNELKQTIIRAKGDELKYEFYDYFVTIFPISIKKLKIEGSHCNIFYAREYFWIGALSKIKEYSIIVGDTNELEENEEIKQLKFHKIYYQNISKQDFSEIIENLRNFYLQCGVYIDCLVINSIIDLYYDKSGKSKEHLISKV